MKKLNILHINGEKNWAGGEVQLFNLCKGLNSQGHNCIIACQKNGALWAKAAKAGFSVEGVPVRGLFDFESLIKLIKIIKNSHIDIVHMHTYSGYYLSAIAAKLSGRVGIVLTRRMDFAIEKNLINKIFFGKMVDKIIAISQAVRNVIIDAGVDSSKVEIIYESIDIDNFPLETNSSNFQADKSDKVKIVGTVAHLYERKGIKFFLEAAHKVIKENPEVKFMVVGDGPLRDGLESYAKNGLGLSGKVTFTGFRNDIKDVLSTMDIFVLPSLKEGLGVAILEAMALAKPVVATKTGGIPESVIDGVTGFLVPICNADLLAEKITYLLNNPDIAKKMGQNGRLRIEEKFNNLESILKHEEIYAEVMQQFNNE